MDSSTFARKQADTQPSVAVHSQGHAHVRTRQHGDTHHTRLKSQASARTSTRTRTHTQARKHASTQARKHASTQARPHAHTRTREREREREGARLRARKRTHLDARARAAKFRPRLRSCFIPCCESPRKRVCVDLSALRTVAPRFTTPPTRATSSSARCL
eukprot:4483976-Pleurochrysis_carterae.AAC.4